MKKYLIGLFLCFMLTMPLSAQQTQRLTFTDIGPGGMFRDVTVNAVHLGWAQRHLSLEGNFLVRRESFLTRGNEWTDWGIPSREPARFSTIREYFDFYFEAFIVWPRYGARFFIDGHEIVEMIAIPSGRVAPIWWDTDGRSFFQFTSVYLVVP